MSKSRFISNGIEYYIESRYEGDILEVYQKANNELIGLAEKDHQVEQVFISYFDLESGHLEEFDTSMHLNKFNSDFPTNETFGCWIAATHPAN